MILFIASFLYINCLQENQTIVELTIDKLYTEEVGKKGTVVINCGYDKDLFSILDTSKTPCFESTITNENINYTVNCGLWSHETRHLYIFCDIEDSIPSGQYSILLNEVQPFTYKNYVISINGRNVEFTKINKDIIDLYADKQIINIEKGKELYDIIFNIKSYNGEKIIMNGFVLDCNINNNKLICPISKNKFEEFLSKKNSQAELLYLGDDNLQQRFLLVPPIDINYKIEEQTDIYVGIKKLLLSSVEKNKPIAYETNITSISNIKTELGTFQLSFINNETQVEMENPCTFRKYETTPLLLVCRKNQEETIWLKEIKNEIEINNSNVKYKFRIQPVKNEEKIDTEGEGSYFYWYYPEELNFMKKDSLFIEFAVNDPNKLDGLTFNEEQKDLTCENKGVIKKCEVTKEHFKGKENGYYFIKHSNHLGKKSISYEISPVKVVLNIGNILSLSLSYTLLFILFMI